MFARTSRLLLRPSWAEDGAMLASLVVQPICRTVLATQADPIFPPLLVFERTQGAPRLVGACSLKRERGGTAELRIWIAPEQRGRGLGSEVEGALRDIAGVFGLRIGESGELPEPVQAQCISSEALPQSLAA